MDHPWTAYLLNETFIDRLKALSDLIAKAKERSNGELKSKKIREDFVNVQVGDFDLVFKIGS